MENPEEVLQALDEFQKMRPSEIPRELEDYLCFVAKTGDPIYQWSLIKPLFREKLVRVMTEFYESCPTLDLATSPNLEHFNYDIMKCNLLELLESFANAPFTVQRICELLTAPRKQYNRVDKFMRAIEKNILVVSTKEPGPAARRSENGDSMVNGSMDDEASATQPGHEVEMESWVLTHDAKDCTTPTPEMPIASAEIPLVQAAMMAEKLAKEPEEPSAESSRSEMAVGGFMSAAHEMTAASLSSSTNDAIISGSHVQNSTGTIADMPGPVADVPEGIMNEDTSSQPSLDSESDESDGHLTKKLQTTFQAKDFAKVESKSPKFFPEKTEIKSIHSELSVQEESSSPIQREDGDSKSDDDSKSSCDSGPEVLEKRPRLEADCPPVVEHNESSESCSLVEKSTEKSASEALDTVSTVKADSEAENLKELVADEAAEKSVDPAPTEDQTEPEFPQITEVTSADSSQSSTQSEPTKESSPEEPTEPSNVVVEERAFEEVEKSSEKVSSAEERGVTIEEAMDDDVKQSESLVPDPIPIVEEPKDEPPVENIVPIAPEVAKDQETDQQTTIQDQNISDESKEAQVQTSVVDPEPACILTSITPEKVESMDVDTEESMQVQQDEPMDQECEQLTS